MLLGIELDGRGRRAVALEDRRVLAGVAGARNRLHVGLPRTVMLLELIDQVLAGEPMRRGARARDLGGRQIVPVRAVAGTGDELLGRAGDRWPRLAIVPDAIEVAREEREIVREARVRDAEVVRRDAVLAGESSQVRGVGGVS